MPKISNQSKYPEQEIVNKKDYVIGTDYYDKKKTKTFPIQNLAQVLADILIEDGGIEINVGKTSQLINDGEFGDSRFVEENELTQIIQEILSSLDKYELTKNKQNNLNPDGTGIKFPTVDAVIQAVYEINLKLSNKSDVDGANSVGNLKDSIDKRHSHPHQEVIDSITAQDIINWNNSIGQSHNPLSLGLNTVGLSLNAAAQILQLTPGYSIPTNVDITKWNNLSNSIGNYALRDASNLLNITNWRTVLDLYSKPQVDNLLNLKQDKLTAGANIQISPTNVISATDTTYSQGSGISIVGGVITNTAQNVTQTLGLSGQLLSLSNGGGSVVLPFTDWSNITNKPSTFAPSAHTHTSNEVISLTGYTLGANSSLTATDSLNTALGKLQAQVNSKTSNTGTVTSVTAGSGLAGGVITTSGIISLSAATLASLAMAASSLQPGDPISLLNNDVPYATESWVNSQGYLTSFTETDPTVPSHVKGISTTDIAYWNAKLNASALNGYATELWVQQQNYLTSFTEVDPIFTASPAFGITNANITNWNSKFTFPSGGNAGQYLNGLGNLVSFPTIPNVGNGNISYNGTGSIVGGGTSTANQSANTSYNFDLSATTKSDIGLGVTANSWGDHSLVGYLTSASLNGYATELWANNRFVQLTDPRIANWTEAYNLRHTHANKAVLDNLTQSVIDNSHIHTNKAILDGTQESFTTTLLNKLNSLSNYVLPIASATVLGGIRVGTNLSIDVNGILSASFNESDPIFTSSPAFGITNTNITNWNNAFNNSHTHTNKALLDTYDQTNANITDAVNLRHSHANKTILDSIVNKNISQWVNDSGYLTSFTESDPTVPTWVKSITQANITYWNNKQDKLTAGANIQISPTNVISATDTNTITRLRGTIAGTYQSGDLTLLAGNNVSIIQNGNDFTINSSYVNTTYTSSNGIQLIGNNFSPVYGTSAGTIAQGNDVRINNGQTAFGWGNHAGLYPLLSGSYANPTWISSLDWSKITNKPTIQAPLTNGLHTLLNGNKVDVKFDVGTFAQDKSNKDRLLFGNTASTDVVIKGAVTNGDFKVKDSTDADLFRINGANKVPYFPQLPAPQTGDLNLAVFDAGNGLWKHSTKISDLVTTSVLNAGLATKANVNGNNTTGGINWDIQRILSSNLAGISGNGQIFYQTGNQIFWGNPNLLQHTFETSEVNGLKIYVPSAGTTANIWHGFNFDPNSKANTSGYYSGLSVGNADNSTRWNGEPYNGGAEILSPQLFMTHNGANWGYTSWQTVKNYLGINNAWNLQQVTNNGSHSTHQILSDGGFRTSSTSYLSRELYTDDIFKIKDHASGGSQRLATGGLLASYNYADTSLIPNEGIYSKGTIRIGEGLYFDRPSEVQDWSVYQKNGGIYFYVGGGSITGDVFNISENGRLTTLLDGNSEQWNEAYNKVNTLNPKTTHNINLTDPIYDQDTWYPVYGYLGGGHMLSEIYVNITLGASGNPYWATHAAGFQVDFLLETIASGWGGTGSQTRLIRDNQRFINTGNRDMMPVGYSQAVTASLAIVWLRGGGIYNIHANFPSGFTVATSTTTIGSDTFSPSSQRVLSYVENTVYHAIKSDNVVTFSYGDAQNWYSAYIDVQKKVNRSGDNMSGPLFFDGQTLSPAVNKTGVYSMIAQYTGGGNNPVTTLMTGLVDHVGIEKVGSWYKRLIFGGNNADIYFPNGNYTVASETWVTNNFASNTALANYALLSQVPTNNNQLTNGANYTTLPIVQSWVGMQGFFQFPSGGNSGQYLNGLGQLVNFPTIPPQLVYTGSNGINVTGTVISPTYGTTAGTIAQGNDARINNGQTAFGWGNHAGLYPLLSGSYANPTWISSLDWSKITNAPTIPTVGNGQLSFTAPTGLAISGTFNANQSGNTTIPITWQAGYQGYTTAESTKLAGIQAGASVPNNGIFTVTGDGVYVTGGGSTSANASANTTAPLTLSPQTINDIQQGVEANIIIPSIIEGVKTNYINTTATTNILIEKKKTIVNFSAGVIGAMIQVKDGLYEGYELAINGCGEWSTYVEANIQDKCGIKGTIYLTGNSALFWWSEEARMWIQAI